MFGVCSSHGEVRAPPCVPLSTGDAGPVPAEAIACIPLYVFQLPPGMIVMKVKPAHLAQCHDADAGTRLRGTLYILHFPYTVSPALRLTLDASIRHGFFFFFLCCSLRRMFLAHRASITSELVFFFASKGGILQNCPVLASFQDWRAQCRNGGVHKQRVNMRQPITGWRSQKGPTLVRWCTLPAARYPVLASRQCFFCIGVSMWALK